MDLTEVSKGVHKRKLKKRVGRGPGSGHGKTGSRGHKGQYASAGANLPGPLFTGGQTPIHRTFPKRGFTNRMFAKVYAEVNVGDLEKLPNRTTVTAETLKAAGIVNGTWDGLRVLGNGELTKTLYITADHFTAGAKTKIEFTGGTTTLVVGPKKPVRNKMGQGKRGEAKRAKEAAEKAGATTPAARPNRRRRSVSQLLTIFRIPELRRKIFITLMFLAVYRIGYYVPLPMIDQAKMAENMANMAGGALSKVFGFVSMFSGGNLSTGCIFALGIMPYISASIIMQLLSSGVLPSLERLRKEGESGRKKINEYTRWLTVPICLVQATMFVQSLIRQDDGTGNPISSVWPAYAADGTNQFFFGFAAVIVMTAGCLFLMWLGEQIDEYGIGNGISLIIMAGIVSRIPEAVGLLLFVPGTTTINPALFTLGSETGDVSLEKLVILLFLFVGVVVGVIAITKAQRRIPTQSARHVRGRRAYGGTRQFLPMKVNAAGVMPVIFASTLLILPGFLFRIVANLQPDALWADNLASVFMSNSGWLYNVLYIVLIYLFCYFWVAITFNPKEIADNLKDYGSFIPGYRPGKSTADYLERVLLRITYVGAAFLAIVAIIPSIVSSELGIQPTVAAFFGGTGLLIVVSVALDLVQKINSHLVMRNYKSLTEE